MIRNKKISLSLLNSIFLFLFLTLVIVGIILFVFFSTQKVIDYNVNEYFKQTSNITNLIVEKEQESLNMTAIEVSSALLSDTSKEERERTISNIISVDQIDLVFLVNDKGIEDYSNSLFDTQGIIRTMDFNTIVYDNSITTVLLDNEMITFFLSKKKIIDEDTGRVISTLFLGKILNDNFKILNSIQQKANLEEVSIFYKDHLLGTTSKKELISQEAFVPNRLVKKNGLLYYKYPLSDQYHSEVNIVFTVKNTTFELIKDDSLKLAYTLVIFILISFIFFYLFTNKYMIEPFARLLQFAKRAKDNKNEVYTATNVEEFDDFAMDLKTIIDELRELKEQYSRAIDGVEDGLWDINLKNNTIFCSKTFYTMLGYDASMQIQSIDFWKQSIHKEDYFKSLKALVRHLHGDTHLFETNYRFLCKNGRYKWIRVRGKLFLNEEQVPVRITGFHTDIEDITKLTQDNIKKEQMLYQQNKLAAMGEMIGNIAHQWRQPLNVISTIASSQLIQIELGTSDKKGIQEDLNRLIDTVQYLSTIIEKFRNFFNPNKQIEEFYLDELMDENKELLESSYVLEKIELIKNFEHIKITGYKFELMQVIINLINNARDALLNQYAEEEVKLIFLSIEKEENSIVIRVKDNAGGVKASIKDKIYEPYFTTKHKAQGTGLGLYMSSEIMKKHFKGSLLNETVSYIYEGVEQEGEEFKIIIPL